MTIDEILLGCLNGDNISYDKVYSQLYPVIFKVCMRYSSSKEEGEDLIQETFIKVFDNLRTFKGDNFRMLGGWAKKISVNHCIDHIKKRKVNMSEQVNLERHIIEEDASYDDKYKLEEVMGAIQQLTPTYKAIVNMFILDGFSHQEITNELDLKPGVSKALLFKAKKRIKQLLNKSSE